MLGGVGFTLFLDLNLLLVNLSCDLLLDLTCGLLLLCQLFGHLGTLLIDLLLEFLVLASEVFVLFSNLVNGFLVLLVFLFELSFDAVEMVVEALLNRRALFPFLLGDLLVADIELFVLVIVLTGEDFVPLFD